MRRIGLAVLLLLVVAQSSALARGLDLGAEESQLKSRKLALRAPSGTSRVDYVSTAIGECYVVYESSLPLKLKSLEPIQVNKLASVDDYVELRLRSDRFGKATISFHPPVGVELDRPSLLAMFDEVLADDGAGAVTAVIGNRESKMVHARGANHLPPKDQQVTFASLAEAQTQGFRACPLCFRRHMLMTGFEAEKSLGKVTEGLIRSRYEVSGNDSLTAVVTNLGKKILSSWPVALRGYDYSFRVVKSDDPNAFACPGGTIYVTSGLLDCAESASELEAVLAHEIAHVERRHGYRMYRRAQRAANVANAIAFGAGVAVSAKTGSVGAGVSATYLVSAIGLNVAQAILAGYSRAEESEADGYAIAYLGSGTNQNRLAAFKNVLEKLEYLATLDGPPAAGASLFATHPELRERISMVSGADVEVPKEPENWIGLNDDGDPVAKASIELLASFAFKKVTLETAPSDQAFNTPGRHSEAPVIHLSDQTQLHVFATVEGFTEMRGNAKLDDLQLTSNSVPLMFDNREDTELFPGESVGVDYILTPYKGLPHSIEALDLKISGVKRWVRDSSAAVAGSQN